MTIFVYKELTRNPEIRNTSVWVLLNIRRLERVKDAKFGTNVSNKKLLNAAKQNVRVTAFTISELQREKQQGGKGGRVKLPPNTPILGLTKNHCFVQCYMKHFAKDYLEF